MPPKRKNIGSLTKEAIRMRKKRQNETEDEKAQRNERNRLRRILRRLQITEMNRSQKHTIQSSPPREPRIEASQHASKTTYSMARKKEPDSSRQNNPRNNRSRAQIVRRAKEKEAMLNLLKKQQLIDESFQDFLEESTSIGHLPTRSREIQNLSKGNKNYSDFSQNVTIIDSVSVIKTEILDPSEMNHELIFQNYSKYATVMGSMPVIKTETLDLSTPNQELLLPKIKVEQRAVDGTSRTERLCTTIINNKNSLKTEKVVSEMYPNVHLLPGSDSQFLPRLSEGYKKIALPKKKKKLSFNQKVHHNKVINEKICSDLSNAVCGCFKKSAKRKQMYENIEFLQQDDANQLCLCQKDSHTLTGSVEFDEKVMKKFCLDYPDFGKICNNNFTR